MERFIMFRTSWFPWRSFCRRNGRPRHLSSSRAGRRRSSLILERLEDRTALSNFNAVTVSDLIADINAANKAGGTNTITLTAPTSNPYMLIAVDNCSDGPTGLPVITGGNKPDTLTIVGNGDTIERSTASGTPDFRLFDVASGASLTLQNLTLQNGEAFGSGAASEGGAIINRGTLGLDSVTVQNNKATGSNGQNAKGKGGDGTPGADGAGGGVWSSGTLTADNGTLIQNNMALGGNGGNADPSGSHVSGGNGGNASGGGVDITGGTANLAGATLSGNSAFGGNGGAGFLHNLGYVAGGTGGVGTGGGLAVAAGSVSLSSDTVNNNETAGGIGGLGGYDGNAYGGGLYIGGGTVTLCNDMVEFNTAMGAIASPSSRFGGGIYIAAAATVYIDTSTVDSKDPTVVNNNTDRTGTNGITANIDGTYIAKNC
jgi:hypothetical protein